MCIRDRREGAGAAATTTAEAETSASARDPRKAQKVSLERYRRASAAVMECLQRLCAPATFEKASIDEAYVDLSALVDRALSGEDVSAALRPGAPPPHLDAPPPLGPPEGSEWAKWHAGIQEEAQRRWLEAAELLRSLAASPEPSDHGEEGRIVKPARWWFHPEAGEQSPWGRRLVAGAALTLSLIHI